MDKEKLIELTASIQEAVEQMKLDDIEEAGEYAYEEFQCECCAENKIMAGSVIYNDNRLCNDCVLLAEVAFATGKIKTIEELIKSMEDKRLESFCEYIKEEEKTNKE